jgi:hypothetical protein
LHMMILPVINSALMVSRWSRSCHLPSSHWSPAWRLTLSIQLTARRYCFAFVVRNSCVSLDPGSCPNETYD